MAVGKDVMFIENAKPIRLGEAKNGVWEGVKNFEKLSVINCSRGGFIFFGTSHNLRLILSGVMTHGERAGKMGTRQRKRIFLDRDLRKKRMCVNDFR